MTQCERELYLTNVKSFGSSVYSGDLVTMVESCEMHGIDIDETIPCSSFDHRFINLQAAVFFLWQIDHIVTLPRNLRYFCNSARTVYITLT